MKIWIGFLEPHAALVEATERLLRTTGHEVTWRSYPDFPVGGYLGTLLSRAETTHDTVAWILEPSEHAESLERAILAREKSDSYRLFRIRDGCLYGVGDPEPLGPATLDTETAFTFSRLLVGQSRLL